MKTRSENAIYKPYEAVTSTKQKKILRAAMQYLGATGNEKQVRFDIIEVYLTKNPFFSVKTKKIIYNIFTEPNVNFSSLYNLL